ncbi:MAG: hypothetical protein U0136_00005 [Bdellovibrionota bacterium]
MTRNMWVATIAWLLLSTGYFLRRRRALHITLMLTGIFMDISLVLFLEVSRGAIETALSFSLSLMKQLHIAASTTAFLLYFPVLYLGSQLVRGTGDARTRERHVRLATLALLFRTLGFFLMFSMWKTPAEPLLDAAAVSRSDVERGSDK